MTETQTQKRSEDLRERLAQAVKEYETTYRTKGKKAANDFLDKFKGSYAAEIRHQAFQ